MTAALMLLERPKSSALTMRRRRGSRRSIIGRQRTAALPQPGAKDQQDFLEPAQARLLRSENVELPRLELVQEPPIHRTHQFGGGHRTTILARQQFAGAPVMEPGSFRHGIGNPTESVSVLKLKNLLFLDPKTFEFGLRQVNAPPLGVDANVAQNVGQLKGLPKMIGIIATKRIGVAEYSNAE